MNTEAPTPPEGYEMFEICAPALWNKSWRYMPKASLTNVWFGDETVDESILDNYLKVSQYWFCRPIQNLIRADIPISKPSPPESVLQEAERVSYESVARLAALWTDYFKNRKWPKERITVEDVTAMLSLKAIEEKAWNDLRVYAALGADIEAYEAAPE